MLLFARSRLFILFDTYSDVLLRGIYLSIFLLMFWLCMCLLIHVIFFFLEYLFTSVHSSIHPFLLSYCWFVLSLCVLRNVPCDGGDVLSFVCSLQAKSQFKSRSIANNVEIIIPVPNDVDSPTFKASIGSVAYLPDQVRIALVGSPDGFMILDDS